MPAFELSKWYADCVTAEGDAAIVYHAELRWLAITVHYSSLLIHGAGSPTRVLYSLRKRPAPVLQGDQISWQSPDWLVAGTWQDLGPSYSNLLFQSESGSLEWNCIAPRASAVIRVGSEPTLRGWGYVEHLRLSLAPWKLPIRRLRWGRFVNETDALVWIDWSGPYTKRVVYLNGTVVTATEISDSEIVLKDQEGVLRLDAAFVLRDGLLGSTALSVVPHLDRVFPDSVLNMRECKWLSRAVLQRPGYPDSIGMAIHEVVEWP